MPGNPPFCPRCGDERLRPVDSPESITFYECPRCERRWTQRTAGGPVAERWGGALSLALYGAMFDQRPQDSAEWQAKMLAHLDTDRLIAAIELELAEPSQSVRDIHNAVATEADLREYLARLVRALREQ